MNISTRQIEVVPAKVASRGIGECSSTGPATDQIDREIKAHILCHNEIGSVRTRADIHKVKKEIIKYENQTH